MTRQMRGRRGEVRRRSRQVARCWTRRSARRADTTAASGTPITTRTTSIRCSERSPAASGAPVNGTWTSKGRNRKKRAKPSADARERRNVCLHRRDHRDSAAAWRRRAASPRSAPHAVAADSRHAVADQDEHWQHEGDGSADKDELQDRSAPEPALAGVAVGRRMLDGLDLDRAGGL